MLEALILVGPLVGGEPSAAVVVGPCCEAAMYPPVLVESVEAGPWSAWPLVIDGEPVVLTVRAVAVEADGQLWAGVEAEATDASGTTEFAALLPELEFPGPQPMRSWPEGVPVPSGPGPAVKACLDGRRLCLQVADNQLAVRLDGCGSTIVVGGGVVAGAAAGAGCGAVLPAVGNIACGIIGAVVGGAGSVAGCRHAAKVEHRAAVVACENEFSFCLEHADGHPNGGGR